MIERPLEVTEDDGVLRLRGAVDEQSVVDLRERLRSLIDAGAPLVVDLSDVDYLPSFGVGVLVRARSAAERAGQRFELLAASGSIAQRVLVVTGIPHETEV